MVEFLLDNGADVHAPPAVNGGATALQLAAIQGSVRIVRLLLDKGADIHAASAVVHGRTSLEGAAEHGRVSVLNILLAEGAAGYGVEEIKSAKAYAEKEGHRGCEERLKLALFRFGEAGGSRALLGLWYRCRRLWAFGKTDASRLEEQQPENSFRSTSSSYGVMIMAGTKAPSLVGMEDEEEKIGEKCAFTLCRRVNSWINSQFWLC
jgi:hypothetical protein